MFDLQVLFLHSRLSSLSSSRTNQKWLYSGYCGCPGDAGFRVVAAFFESGETLSAISSEFIPICPSVLPLLQFPASSISHFHHYLCFDLSHSRCAHPALFHCPFIPKFHSNIPLPSLSPHIDRHKYLLTAGCVVSPNHFFHSPPSTPQPTAPTIQPLAFPSKLFSNQCCFSLLR